MRGRGILLREGGVRFCRREHQSLQVIYEKGDKHYKLQGKLYDSPDACLFFRRSHVFFF